MKYATEKSPMKRILLFATLFFSPLLCWAQENFYIDNGAVIWRHVYKTDADLGTIERNLRARGCFRDFYTYGGVITAELRGLKMNVEAAGYKRMQVPIYLPNGVFSAFVTIQVKEGRYRVTVRQIAYDIERIGISNLTNVALKDGQFDDKFIGAPSNIINFNFFLIFANLGEEEDDDW